MRSLWPSKSPVFVSEGYFHTESWFLQNPCAVNSSFSWGDQTIAVTWLSASTEAAKQPLLAFQRQIWRSAVPPPEASKCLCQGHHLSALTAALCFVSVCSGPSTAPARSQMQTVLSLPPDASRPSEL